MTAKNQINPAKLKLSKWTAVQATGKERHFMIIGIVSNKAGQEIYKIESVVTGKTYHVDIAELRNAGAWQMGWH